MEHITNQELLEKFQLLETKQELLAGYASKQPTKFMQYDGFGPDSIDDEGHGITWGPTVELMTVAPASGRVLIPEGAPRVLAGEILQTIADRILNDRDFARELEPECELKDASDNPHRDIPF